MRPDFIFFSEKDDGTVVADIVDPHGTHLSDALLKLQGLARYAEEHSKVYRRIESLAKLGDTLRVLDFTDPAVRKAVNVSKDAKSLFESSLAISY